MNQLESFKEKKREMGVSEDEDTRVIERLVQLNPGIVKCPTCNGVLEVHHWEKEEGVKVPYFKCKSCGFLG